MRAALAASLLLIGCEPKPKCHGPSHAVDPARPADAPAVALGAFTLGIDAARAQEICVAAAAEWIDGRCVGQHVVTLRFDVAGRVHEIELDGLTPEELDPLLTETTAAITAVVGEPNDSYGDRSSWYAGGGELTLEREASGLHLRYWRDDMEERVTYGLPTCG